jgi:hypothetical protein
MDPKLSTTPDPTTPTDPAAEPAEVEKGLPRLVLEARCHLGPTATPETVVIELRNHGVEATVEDVQQLWPADEAQNA